MGNLVFHNVFINHSPEDLVSYWIGVYALRVHYLQGFYIITYGLGIYGLNMFIGFLTPREDFAAQDGPTLPSSKNEEFKPFLRRLPEFQFWKGASRATIISIICTFFPFLDIPVFWPILLLYFIILFVLTMKRQIRHMIKYRYLPWTWGKKTYSAGEKSDDITKKAKPLPKVRPPIRSLKLDNNNLRRV